MDAVSRAPWTSCLEAIWHGAAGAESCYRSPAMAGNDQLRNLSLHLSDIGRRTKCPRCLEVGVIDDIQQGNVIIRHDADVWHVMHYAEACQILWPKLLRS